MDDLLAIPEGRLDPARHDLLRKKWLADAPKASGHIWRPIRSAVHGGTDTACRCTMHEVFEDISRGHRSVTELMAPPLFAELKQNCLAR
jgi:hypothetical protein